MAKRLPSPRAVPWLLLLRVAQQAQEHWQRLSAGERAELQHLLKTSKGRPGNLTAAERDEVKRLATKLDVPAFAKGVAPLYAASRFKQRAAVAAGPSSVGLEDKKRFEPQEVEPPIGERWLASGAWSPDVDADGDPYAIAVPPPNVTGALHMGHALNGSIQDTLARWHRGAGDRVKWTYGTDHAGIATQTQVEKLLVREGTSREALGREAFVERTWAWREQYGGTIREQFKRLGASLDFEHERFTLDPEYAEAVLEVFVDLHEQGLIYRDNYLVNWDPGTGSAISDLEVEEREETDELFSIAYPLADGDGEVVVATVRPETMLADTAIAVNPSDERFAHLIGRRAILPLVGRELPIIGDDYVKTDFGTGCLKITPGHDPNDFEIGRKHGLEELTVIGEDGRMTDAAGAYAGLTVLEARERVVADLGDAVRAREPHTHVVPYSHRSGERIEPLISLQWFMRMDELARPAIDAVRDGRVRIHPPSQAKRYVDWLEGIRPWCISRQLWWGHQIPVWYRGADETYVGTMPPDGDGWEQDPDVLDTWFSSGLWPFATLGWPEQTPELEAFHPTAVLSTARDILFLWVARMVMLGLRFTGDVPFRDVYVHSVIQAPDGRRMSKSLGTGIDPLELIDRHGADATRWGLLAMSSTQDVRFSEEKIAQGASLANKLFNATRLLLGRIGDAPPAPRPTAVEDRWILSRLEAAKAGAQGRVDEFDFSKLAFGLYDFVFGELCDWYLEMVKGRPDDPDLSSTLHHLLRETLELVHPVMPYVTEELWSHLPGEDGLLAVARRTPAGIRDEDAERQVGKAIETIRAVRTWRDANGVKPGLVLDARGADDPLVARLARLAWVDSDEPAVATIAGVEVVTPVVDPAEEARRRDADRAALRSEVARAEGKLANAGFVAKAPPAVVAAEQAKLDRLRAELDAL